MYKIQRRVQKLLQPETSFENAVIPNNASFVFNISFEGPESENSLSFCIKQDAYDHLRGLRFRRLMLLLLLKFRHSCLKTLHVI